MSELNKERLCKWTKALESGKYLQAIRQLKNKDVKDSYCALGVACRVYEEETGDKLNYDEYNKLPRYVAEWYGLIDLDPVVFFKAGASTASVSWLNDAGVNFIYISKTIKENFELTCEN